MRLLVASDCHGSEIVWRKLLNAVRLDIWQADAVLYAGDLAGKAFVPIIQTDRGWVARLRGIDRAVRKESDLPRLERDIADLGMYSRVVTESEATSLTDPAVIERYFNEAIEQRLRSWLQLADERLRPKGVPLFLIPGNDDPAIVDGILAESRYAVNVDRRVAHLPDGREITGLSPSNPTPWDTPREMKEDELGGAAEQLLAGLESPGTAVAMFHAPPAGLLDQAPKLDPTFRPILTGTGDMVYTSVGSTAHREVLERYQPALAVHGHIHEAGGHAGLGRTLCVNPGSEYFAGVLKAYLLELDGESIRPIRAEA